MILLSLAVNFPEDQGQIHISVMSEFESWSWITEMTTEMAMKIGDPMEIGERDDCPLTSPPS